MPTTRSSKSGQAPVPDRSPERAQPQSGGGVQGGAGSPRFVPQHIQRRQQSGGQIPMPGRTPGGVGSQLTPSTQRANARHSPRGLAGALNQPGRQQAPATGRPATGAASGGAGANYTGNVIGQFSANYPNDVWFFDGNLWQWMQIDPTSESGVMLMNEVVSLARAHMLPLYYDTDDNTGVVIDAYAF